MLSGALCTSDVGFAEDFQALARNSELVEFCRVLPGNVQNYELIRTVNGLGVDVVFLDFEQSEAAATLARQAMKQSPHAARIGFLSNKPGVYEENPAPELVDSWLSMPPDEKLLSQALWDAVHRSQGILRKPLYVFLPAKAGSGATTIALHVADVLANEAERDTLFLDADMLSGVTSVMLNVVPEHSLCDVLEQTVQLQPALWSSAVQTVGKLHVLCNRLEQEPSRAKWSAYWKTLQYATAHYDTIVVDLPERVNEATMELTAEAEVILVVTTMELPALKLAERRLRELRTRGAYPERIHLLLNRWHRSDLAPDRVSELLGAPVMAAIPNDYPAMQQAVHSAGFANADTAPGRAFRQLASRLSGVKLVEEAPVRRSFFSKLRA